MFITKKHLSRRTFLQGAGVTLALPLLESMVPAGDGAGAARRRRRRRGSGASTSRTARRWTSGRRRREGTAFEFSEILQPLEPFRDRVCVVSDLAHAPVAPWTGEDTGGAENHVRAAAVFLSGAHPVKKNEAHVGVTVDQVAAQHVGQDTPLPSIELSMEPLNLTCGDAGFTCAYRNTLSWKSADAAAADGEQSAGRVRAAVRRRQHRRAAAGAAAAVAEPARFDPQAGPVAREGSAGRRPHAACATISTKCARSSGGSSRWTRTLSREPRPARRAGRHSGRLRRAPEADVRSAGARLQVGDHAHLDADVRAREQQRRLSAQPACARASTTPRTTRTSARTWISSR